MSKKLLFNLNKNVSQNYTYVKYTGTIVTAINTLEKPIKNAILKGDTKYRDIDTGEILDSFDRTKNLELVSVKMPVLQTTGKNIFYGAVINNKDIGFNDGLVCDGKRTIPLNFIPVKPKSTYTLTRPIKRGFMAIRCYSENQNFLSSISFASPEDTQKFSFTFKTPSGCFFIKFADEANTLNNNYQIEEGSTATSYEPYKTNILTVNEEVILRSNGDVYDELNVLTGKLIQRISEDGEVLSEEITKTVTLNIVDQDGNSVSSVSSFNDTTHISTSSETISPVFEGYIATKESVE